MKFLCSFQEFVQWTKTEGQFQQQCMQCPLDALFSEKFCQCVDNDFMTTTTLSSFKGQAGASSFFISMSPEYRTAIYVLRHIVEDLPFPDNR